MKKLITQEQVTALLQTIYQTNISASTFDAVKKMMNDLPSEMIEKVVPGVESNK